MANNDVDKNIEKALESLENTTETHENDTVVAVEVVKDDTVVYEDGDFEEYNADKDYEVETDDESEGDDESKTDDESESDDESNEKDESNEHDKSGITMAGIYQWASKIKDDFKAEATDITNDVSERAAAMTLKKLINVIDMELAAFDKSVEVAKKLIAGAEEQRKNIASKKDKYQGMIDKLDQ